MTPFLVMLVLLLDACCGLLHHQPIAYPSSNHHQPSSLHRTSEGAQYRQMLRIGRRPGWFLKAGTEANEFLTPQARDEDDLASWFFAFSCLPRQGKAESHAARSSDSWQGCTAEEYFVGAVQVLVFHLSKEVTARQAQPLE